MNIFKNLFKSKDKSPQFVDLPYFNKIDINNTEEYYDVAVEVNKNLISLDLNFIEVSIPLEKIEKAIDFLNRLSEFEILAQTKIIEEFSLGNVVKDYIEHHLEEFNDEELSSLGIGSMEDLENQKQKMLDKLHIKRIGIYPEDSESYGVFDYTINDDLTQYLIVVRFDCNKEFVEIAQES